MGKKALSKDIFKEFSKSITRFISIMLMIALGSFIFVGLYVTGPTMRNTLLSYTDKYQLEDLTVSSPFGLEIEDEAILASVPGVQILDYSYRSDLIIQNSDVIVRAESLGKLPNYEIIQGRLPSMAGEIALDGIMLEDGYKLGNKITFEPKKIQDSYPLNNYDFLVVGFVNSPEYLMKRDKGSSSIGDGKVDGFGIITKNNFALDKSSLARLTFSYVYGLDAYSHEYKAKMQAHSAEVEQAFAARPEIRLAGYQQEGTIKISDAELKISDAQQQLLDAKAKLVAANTKLQEAWASYRAGKVTFNQEIAKAKAELTKGQEELLIAKDKLASGYSLFAAGEKKLATAQAEFTTSEAELIAAKTKLDDGQAQLDIAQKKLNDGKIELAAKTDELNAGLVKISDGLSKISASYAEIDAGIAEITAGLAQLAVGLQQNDAGIVALANSLADIDSQLLVIEGELALTEPGAERDQLLLTKSTLEQQRAEFAAQKTQLEATKVALFSQQAGLLAKQDLALSKKTELQVLESSLLAQKQIALAAIPLLNDAQIQLSIGQQQLDGERASFNTSKVEYENGLSKLEAGRIELAKGTADVEKARLDLVDGQLSYDAGVTKLAAGRTKLAAERLAGENKLRSAYSKLLTGEQDYQEGTLEYTNKLPTAELDIAKGKEELIKSKNQLASLRVPDYTIHDRYMERGFNQFIQNSESMDLLSLFFPVFFFLVALLLSLTTMTRMVDEQRLLIGTLKSLGYSNWDVIKKYLAYGSLASLFGSMLGIVAGQKILMPVVFRAYASNFLFKHELPLLSPVFSFIAVSISLLCTGFVAYLTTRASLQDNVAALLRPKTPKSGNRIFLERLTPIWKRMSFNYKVTARNIFRYKKRMLMTILGVAGCSALIFLGFGIRDSVSTILGKQYTELFRYDSIVIFDENSTPNELADFQKRLQLDNRIAENYSVRFEAGIVKIPGQLDQNVAVVVPEDAKAFSKVNQLRSRKSMTIIPLEHGAVISEKLAHMLGLGVGDKLDFKDNDGNYKTIKIAGITENYVGHYIYLPAGYYEEIFGKAYRANSNYILLHDESDASISLFSESMLEQEVVLSTLNTNVTGKAIVDLTKSLNIVVLVIVLASSMLAMVVLYNLTNINVSERIRELSTIMVLGFYPREVTGYVYRETMFLTTIGIFVGYIFGLMLHSFIVTSLPPANILLDPAVKLTSYIFAAAFTLAFSLIVMLIMHQKLKNIDMVEALKAIE